MSVFQTTNSPERSYQFSVISKSKRNSETQMGGIDVRLQKAKLFQKSGKNLLQVEFCFSTSIGKGKYKKISVTGYVF